MNSDADPELRQPRQTSKVNSDVVERLKVAVRRGGGNKAVAAKSQVKLSTLNNYLRAVAGLPAAAASQIAAACNVSIDWLLRGEGPMEYLPVGHTTKDGLVVQGPAMPLVDTETAHSGGFIHNFDPVRLATALKAADDILATGSRPPTYRQRVQSMILIYNHLTNLQADLDKEVPETESHKKNE